MRSTPGSREVGTKACLGMVPTNTTHRPWRADLVTVLGTLSIIAGVKDASEMSEHDADVAIVLRPA